MAKDVKYPFGNASTASLTATGMTAPTLTGVAGKTFVQKFIYNGTSFFPTGASLQID